MTLVLAAGLALAACGSSTQEQRQNQSGRQERAMLNCPSAVIGAATAMQPIDGGVALVITSPDPDVQAKIRTVARRNAHMDEPSEYSAYHTGRHGGPGTTGHCPVIHAGTEVTMEEIDGGARVIVRADDPTAVAELQQMTAERVEALRAGR